MLARNSLLERLAASRRRSRSQLLVLGAQLLDQLVLRPDGELRIDRHRRRQARQAWAQLGCLDGDGRLVGQSLQEVIHLVLLAKALLLERLDVQKPMTSRSR